MDQIIAYLKNSEAVWNTPDFRLGFALGLLIPFVIILLYMLCRRRSGSNDGLSLEEEGGILFISTASLQTFLQQIVRGFPGLELLKLKFKTAGGRCTVRLYLQAPAGSNLTEIRTGLRSRITEDFKNRLGIEDQLQSIDLDFQLINDQDQ